LYLEHSVLQPTTTQALGTRLPRITLPAMLKILACIESKFPVCCLLNLEKDHYSLGMVYKLQCVATVYPQL
jgi:hypothetical protein